MTKKEIATLSFKLLGIYAVLQLIDKLAHIISYLVYGDLSGVKVLNLLSWAVPPFSLCSVPSCCGLRHHTWQTQYSKRQILMIRLMLPWWHPGCCLFSSRSIRLGRVLSQLRTGSGMALYCQVYRHRHVIGGMVLLFYCVAPSVFGCSSVLVALSISSAEWDRRNEASSNTY